jgi:hypothetical protein
MIKANTPTIRNAKSEQPIKTAVSEAEPSSSAGQRKSTAAGAKPAPANAQRPSKQDRVLDLLRRKEGATVSAIMKATGWQQHSVRGFLAGVVRKKLKLRLTSRDDDNGKRIYRIASSKPPKTDVRAAR